MNPRGRQAGRADHSQSREWISNKRTSHNTITIRRRPSRRHLKSSCQENPLLSTLIIIINQLTEWAGDYALFPWSSSSSSEDHDVTKREMEEKREGDWNKPTQNTVGQEKRRRRRHWLQTAQTQTMTVLFVNPSSLLLLLKEMVPPGLQFYITSNILLLKHFTRKGREGGCRGWDSGEVW